MISSYGKIYAIGHRAVKDILDGNVQVEEKIDGSQISWALIDEELHIRSKGQSINVGIPEKMFHEGVDYLRSIRSLLRPNVVYRGEYLKKPHHNALKYDRIPKNHFCLYDIDLKDQDYVNYEFKKSEAERLGIDIVPLIFNGNGKEITQDKFSEFMQRISILGGAKIEGVVLKNYEKFCPDGKTLMGKYVSEAFKEVHRKEWKQSNPTNKDVLSNLIDEYACPPRWQKALIHLEESGSLLGELKDIPNIIKEVQRDIEEECGEEIKDKLWKWAKSHVLRGAIRGIPEFYKQKLLEKQFEETKD